LFVYKAQGVMPARERSFRVEAVVLSHWDYGEADRMIGLFTREMGKITVLAKGARKARSRKAGHLEPFTRVSLQLAHGQNLHLITQAETVEAYLPLREDLLALGQAAYVVELIQRLASEGEENQALYRLLTATLKRLTEAHDPRLVLRFYEIRLLDLSGFRPKLFLCANCQKQIQAEDQFFSAEMGGVLCPECGSGRSGVRPISMTALKYLRHLQRSNFSDACKASPSPVVYDEMENIMQYYLTYILERRLNTPIFLRRVKAGLKGEIEGGDAPMA
jgi:DNA repair protein RecO (recombination protein O)